MCVCIREYVVRTGLYDMLCLSTNQPLYFLLQEKTISHKNLSGHREHIMCSIINPRRACTARVTVSRACLSECVSVTLNLTCRMFVRLTNDTTYLTGNEGQKFRTVFSENAPLQS